MSKKINRLVQAKLHTLKEGMHADGGCLYLRVLGASRTWMFRWIKDRVEHKLGLGSVDLVSLSEARKKALELRLKIQQGVDPKAEKDAARAAKTVVAAKSGKTFDDCLTGFLTDRESAWTSRKHRQEWEATVRTHASPLLGLLPIESIDVDQVLDVLRPIWTSKPAISRVVRGRIENILDWAKAQKYRSGENPARWKGHLEFLLAKRSKAQKRKHHAALPYAEVAGLMEELRGTDTLASAALQFLILCASRTEEVLGARWEEIDLDARLWIVPAERMKARTEHRVPLSPAAVEVVKKMAAIRHGDRIFPVSRVIRLLSDLRPGATTHGFRSSFRDWTAEQTSHPRELAEKALAHAVGDETERAYQRGDLLEKRRRLMNDWADYCTRPAAPVLQFKGTGT